MITKDNCICSNWEIISPFRSMIEYKKFEEWIENLVTEKSVNKIESKNSTRGNKVYQCNGCNKMWSLNEPDAPFGGSFGPLG